MIRPFHSIALTALALVPLTACKALTQEFPAVRTVDAENERVLWDSLLSAVQGSGHPIGGGADPAGRTVRTGWKLDTAPFKGRGFRTRVLASYVPSAGERLGTTSAEPAPGCESFDVTLRVEKETNESLSPLNLDRAKWTPADDDAARARALMQQFHGLLGTAVFELNERKPVFGIE